MDGICFPNLFLCKMCNDVISWYMLWPVPSFLSGHVHRHPSSSIPQDPEEHRNQNQEQQAFLFSTLALLNAEMSHSSFHSHCMVFHPCVMDNPCPLTNPHATLCTSSIMILIPKLPRFLWNTHEARTCVLVEPLRH